MKKQIFINTHPRREAAEKDGIALMLSGSYILSKLDQCEFDSLRQLDQSKIIFSEQPSVVLTNAHSKSKRGKLARIASLSGDSRFARYRHPVFPSQSSIISLQLIKATAFTPNQFVTLLRSNDTLHIRRQFDGKEWVGVHFGSKSHTYSTLVIPAETPLGFDFVDIETEPNPHNTRSIVSIVPKNLTSGEDARNQILNRYTIN